MTPSTAIEACFEASSPWSVERTALREILLQQGLDETLKWRQPAYAHRGRTLAILSCLKASATVSFLDGALLDDPENLLRRPGENSRHARYMTFESLAEVHEKRAALEAFLQAAMAASEAGRRVSPPSEELEPAPELRQRFEEEPALAAAFAQLSPGRRRAYHLHFEGAKRAATRRARIERCASRILAGKGLQDCVCGRSKRLPRCDGSHREGA